MKRLIIIRGLPGSGKTTLAKLICPQHCVSADDFMVNEAGEYDFSFSRLAECHDRCKSYVEGWMESDVLRIAVHNVFSSRQHAQVYYDLAHKYGYEVFVVEAQNRFESEHDVPVETMLNMKMKWEPLYKEFK